MGLNIGLNAITAGGLGMAVIALVIMGILLVSASVKVGEIPEYNQSEELQNAKNRLKTAYILTFIAAGVALLLGIVYGGHDVVWSPSEWIHGFIFLVIVVLIVIALIYAYTVLDVVYDSRFPDRVGSSSYIWAALLFALVSLMFILAMGTGRASYNLIRDKAASRFNELERKVHATHEQLTGEPVDYDFIGADKPKPDMMVQQ